MRFDRNNEALEIRWEVQAGRNEECNMFSVLLFFFFFSSCACPSGLSTGGTRGLPSETSVIPLRKAFFPICPMILGFRTKDDSDKCRVDRDKCRFNSDKSKNPSI